MNNRFLRLIQLCVLTLDLLSLNVLVIASQFWMDRINGAYSLDYARFWVWLNASWILVTWLSNLYYERHIVSFENFSRRSMHAYFYWLVLLMLYLFFTHQFGLSRFFIAIILLSQGVMLLINRFIYLLIRSYYKRRNLFIKKVMIVGYNDTAKKLVSYLEEEGMNTEIVGFCEEPENVYELSHYPILSSIANTIQVSHHHRVNEIYSTIAPEQDLGIYQLMKEADQACIHFRLIPDLSFFVKRVVHISYLKDIPILSLRHEPLSDAGNRIRKRLFDIAFSMAVIILLLSWLVPLLGLLIRLDSRGPVLFKQPRTGQGKKTFNCLKFRSMKVNKDAHSIQATQNDSRLTRLGKFIRKTSLDELPQFFNVLRGDMSIVGPRPHMLKHTDDYSQLIEQYMVRQFLKPGITGWAQINGFRGETRSIEDMEGRVEHDIWYMENWGLWLDVRIIFLTGFNIFKGEKKLFSDPPNNCPLKFITTSWDDGHPLDHRIAELLDKYRLKGTFYVPQKNPEHEVMQEKNIMVLSGKFEIGGHTLNHVNLKQLNNTRVFNEVSGCFNWLKDLTKTEPVSFCLPFGSYKKESLPIIYNSGFKFIRTTALLSPLLKSPLTDTTLQVYNHTKLTYLKHLLKRRRFNNLWLWLNCGYTTDALRLLDYYLYYIECNGGCLHVWGHSWEIEAFHLWKKLELILKHISNRNEFEYISNGTLAKYH